MRCEECRGEGVITAKEINRAAFSAWLTKRQTILAQYSVRRCGFPCKVCGGSGITSCCDGTVGDSSEICNR